MRCEQIRELLSPYIDQMTDEKENKLVDAHLAQCQECRQELDYLKTICGALGSLEHPQIPERFTEDLHKRLLEEKTGIFVAKEVKRPKRSGWIAAGVAGLALAVGIYASSLLPIGTIVASLQDKSDKQQNKPQIAIEDIIRSIKGWNTENPNSNIDVADNNTPEVATPIKESNKPKNNDVEQVPNQVDNELPPVVPKFTDEYSTKIKVADAGQAANQVIQLAQANKIEYVLSPNTTTMQALSATNAKEITLKVSKEKAEDLLNQLGGIGKVSDSVHNQIELTQKYSSVEEQIFTTERLIKNIENKDNISEVENKQLEELKNHLKQCSNEKIQLEKELNQVILKVFLVEEVKP